MPAPAVAVERSRRTRVVWARPFLSSETEWIFPLDFPGHLAHGAASGIPDLDKGGNPLKLELLELASLSCVFRIETCLLSFLLSHSLARAPGRLRLGAAAGRAR